MSYIRPPIEDEFVNAYLKREVRALGVDGELLQKFITFAVNEGRADARKLRPRLYHVLKGRTPSAYLALLVIRFFRERKYENFNRTTKDFVEYITSDGNTEELERLVANHPLMLRIVRVRMTNWVVTGTPNSIDIYMRSPIPQLDEPGMDENTACDRFNERLGEFQRWLATQGHIPKTHQLKHGQILEIRHEPDWLKYSDETGFEWESDFRGAVDISQGVRIMVFAELGSSSPDIHPHLLDTFDHLSSIFEGTKVKPAPKRLSFDLYWPRIVERECDVAEVFFTHIQRYSTTVRSKLERFFKEFAMRHRDWGKKAMADMKLLDKQGDAYEPSPEDAFHYNQVKEVFFKNLKPVMKSCWVSFAKVSLEILETEKVKARAHYEKIKKHFA